MQNINTILNRVRIENDIKQILNEFEEKCNEQTFKKGMYIYGAPGTGKTKFVTEILKSLDYDVITLRCWRYKKSFINRYNNK